MSPQDLSSIDTNAVGAGAGIFGTVFLVATVVVALLMIIAMWKMFSKAGRPGWAALIPIYNMIVMHQIVKKPAWWIILYLFPVISLVIQIIIGIELGKAFGKSAAFSAVFILLLPIGFFIIAFDDSKYQYGMSKASDPQPPQTPPGATNPIPPTPPATS